MPEKCMLVLASANREGTHLVLAHFLEGTVGLCVWQRPIPSKHWTNVLRGEPCFIQSSVGWVEKVRECGALGKRWRGLSLYLYKESRS